MIFLCNLLYNYSSYVKIYKLRCYRGISSSCAKLSKLDTKYIYSCRKPQLQSTMWTSALVRKRICRNEEIVYRGSTPVHI